MNGYYKGERVIQDYISKTKDEAMLVIKKHLLERFGEDYVIDEEDITVEFTHKYHANNSRDTELKIVTVEVANMTFNANIDSQRNMAAALAANQDTYLWVDADNETQQLTKAQLQEVLSLSHQATTAIWTQYRDIKNNLAAYPQDE
jgi:hypothetical protein